MGYTEHKLLSLTADGQLEVDSFKLPSACACFVREDFMLEFRDAMKDSDGAEALAVGGDATPLPHQVFTIAERQFKNGNGKNNEMIRPYFILDRFSASLRK